MLKTKYDWTDPKIPNWVKRIATNENGEVFGFTNNPILDGCSLGWEGTDENHKPMKIDLQPYKDNWEESLEERQLLN